MNKKVTSMIAATMATVCAFGFTACGGAKEKNITVVVREAASGTREAFDKVVTDGEHYLQEKDESGNTVYNTTKSAVQQTSTGTVLSAVANDKNAIGYISLGSVNDGVNVVKVGGVTPSNETVLSGEYSIQRPFVVMTNANVELTARAQDFMNYLHSDEVQAHAETAGVIFLEDETKRANAGETAIPVIEYSPLENLPEGDKIVIRGSTSMEKFINAAAKGYAEQYEAKAENIFDIQLNGSSEGKKKVIEDTTGNTIGLSSAKVADEKIHSFNVCLDAVAVVVNKSNTTVTDLTLQQLYEIFSGKVTKFSALE
ncbi:MAG: substrate-binding domain-containing protein [Clostridia bacterium]|nr:substrate-binding domain-containing protein [Clostridia bacterium]